MRLTIHEQAIIKCICSTKGPATRHHIILHTGLNFATTDQCLARLVITGRLALEADGGFVLTALAKCNPVVKLILQEMVEERLCMDEYLQRRPVKHFFRRSFTTIYSFLTKYSMTNAH